MWSSFYAGMTTTGPLLAMALFMEVFTAAVWRSFRRRADDDAQAALPLDDGVVATTLSSSPSGH